MPKKQNEVRECSLCGSELDAVDAFCPNCGEKINGNGNDDDNDDGNEQPFKGW